MAVTFVDLSLTLEDVQSERLPVSIRYVGHGEGAHQMEDIFGLPPGSLPDGNGWSGEEVTLTTHTGTHMDAPLHYGPFSGGRPARSIDQIPLEWCYGPGIVLDMRQQPQGSEISIDDLKTELRRLNYDLKLGDIVLIMTGADQFWGRSDYPEQGSGLGRASTRWLVDRGVRVIGTDAWGLDRPFQAMKYAYEESGDIGVIWAAHFVGREREYCQLEKLTNLSALPPLGSTVICFPIKVARASAGWCRVVAMF